MRDRELGATDRSPAVHFVLGHEIVQQLVDNDLLSPRRDRLPVREGAHALVQQLLRVAFERALAALPDRLAIAVVLDPPHIAALEETAAAPALHRRPRSSSH